MAVGAGMQLEHVVLGVIPFRLLEDSAATNSLLGECILL